MNKPEQLQPADLGEILFQAAVAQMRADVLKASAKKAAKEIACRCDAYKFPHRKDGGKCGEADPGMDERAQKEIDDEANYLLDRQEAMAINAGRY